jgi:hypothetical protein
MPAPEENSAPDTNTDEVRAQKMCALPVENLKAVCDWLNSDDMPLPQNQIRKALALLFVAEVIEE